MFDFQENFEQNSIFGRECAARLPLLLQLPKMILGHLPFFALNDDFQEDVTDKWIEEWLFTFDSQTTH